MSTKMLKINTYNPVNRAVYAYTTPNDKSHNGWIKIGDTEVKFSKDMSFWKIISMIYGRLV